MSAVVDIAAEVAVVVAVGTNIEEEAAASVTIEMAALN